MYKISSSYLGDRCGGTPYAVYASSVDSCTPTECSASSGETNADMETIDCSSDFIATMRDKFDDSPYLIKLMTTDSTCSKLSMAFGYPASGTCVGAYDKSYYVIAQLDDNGTASLQYYRERSCLSKDLYQTDSANKLHSSSTCALLTATNGTAALMSMTPVEATPRRGQGMKDTKATLNSDRSSIALLETPQTSLGLNVPGQTGLWNDDVITAKRIPRDKVQTQKLISRGAFGEVYAGLYNGQQVAVKMLPPATRTNMKQVNDFLAEAKMNATMDHPHIVTFVGVAWDSLSDLCVVLEYMQGGELRALLDTYLKSKHPVGFDKQKATIALQVCHALTYLHSLEPPVVHRDLKSRNILFTSDMEAKLSDFGVSRETLDQTMTAGVGTSLWMAPEVMLGERYDDKADMFSFGVVLSELDVHTMPYARAKKENLESSGREMVDSVLLQRVALGRLQVEFSDASPEAMVELGRACMSVDPTQRPNAAEALYKLHVICQMMP
ncbi:unnamed protein product [Phytophthora fragariaefolia]|uniref:Unnamed protein product n=1 Tax=Phytophthora fragariaefolia TaxID=1490495 RepID=A0A9W6XC82_9STRA|nr:unnamed protein product [Phytophthora fragariaefolia]